MATITASSFQTNILLTEKSLKAIAIQENNLKSLKGIKQKLAKPHLTYH